MDIESTQVFDKIDIQKQQKKGNPFGLTELEDKFVRRSLPAFLKGAVKYSGDLHYSLIDFRHYLSCFKVPYNEECPQDSYVWRMNKFMMGEDTVFTRSCGAREEMLDIMNNLLDENHQASGNMDYAINLLSKSFENIIEDFSASRTNMRYKVLDGNFVNGLISANKLPQEYVDEKQSLYCAEIIRDAMFETQRDKDQLTEDYKRETDSPTA